MIWITGDLHGDMRRIRDFCKDTKTTIDDVIICLGDVGLNYFCGDSSIKDINDAFENPEENPAIYRDFKQKNMVAKLPITLFCVRGNHEMRPEGIPDKYAHKETMFDGEVIIEDKYPNIVYAVDGEVYKFDDKQCLVIGGAYSVDKWYRLGCGRSWFADEILSPEEMDSIYNKLGSHKDIDIVLTHTSPHSWEKHYNDLFIDCVDQETVDKSMEDFLDSVDGKIDYKLWYFGHFHDDKNISDKGVMLFNSVIPFGEKIKDEVG